MTRDLKTLVPTALPFWLRPSTFGRFWFTTFK
jgi:hypothetical protein